MEIIKKYIDWGAGPRASQNLILGAKTNAALQRKFSPDIEDVKAVAEPILRHRIVRNYKAEADGYSIEKIIFISWGKITHIVISVKNNHTWVGCWGSVRCILITFSKLPHNWKTAC